MNRGGEIILVILGLAVFFTAIAGAGVFYFEKKYADKFYPGVVIAGQEAGGRTFEEINNAFKINAGKISKNGLAVAIEGAVFPPELKSRKEAIEIIVPMYSSGMTADKVVEYFLLDDWQSQVEKAYSLGRQGNFWQKAKEQVSAFFGKKIFNFSPVIQKEAVASFLQNATEDYFLKPSSSRFSLEAGKVLIIPEILGEKTDNIAIIGKLQEKLGALDASESNFKAQVAVPETTKDNLLPFIDLAQKIADGPGIAFHYKDYVWQASGQVVLSWLQTDENKKLVIGKHQLENYLNRTALLYVDSPMQNSRFQMQEGRLVEITPGKPGNLVDVGATAKEIEKYLQDPGKLQVVEIAVINEKPKITQETIDKYEIKELVGSASTNFEGGSIDRQHNIETGVLKLNGILIAPGQEFSAVASIGEISESAGFVKEYVIKSNTTEKELGGGLCQIATTLFRAALNAGLPITERQNHRYVISYYGAGLDATIYGPHPDLRFVNDTGNYLLLQAKAENNQVTIEFYGQKDGRKVEISEPVLSKRVPAPQPKVVMTSNLPLGQVKCTEIPHSGVTADTKYTVTYADGQVKEINFHSVYQPWQKVCLVGNKKF